MCADRAIEPNATDLASLVRYAVLAPSSHNTQPWRFVLHEGGMGLRADRSRSLPATDPDGRELIISCGCALMNLRVAAAHAKIPLKVRLLPATDDPDLLASLRPGSASPAEPALAALFAALPTRRTERASFQERPIPASLGEALADAAASEGAWLEPLAHGPVRQQVAAWVQEGDAIQWSDPVWRRELAAWIRSRQAGDGLAVPRPLAPIARVAVRHLDMGRQVGARDARLARQAPLLAVLGTGGDTTEDWLCAGQALERLLLKARVEGLQASYLNQPIQVASLRAKLRELLPRGGSPQLLLRFGYPRTDSTPPPRRDSGEVMTVASGTTASN